MCVIGAGGIISGSDQQIVHLTSLLLSSCRSPTALPNKLDVQIDQWIDEKEQYAVLNPGRITEQYCRSEMLVGYVPQWYRWMKAGINLCALLTTFNLVCAWWCKICTTANAQKLAHASQREQMGARKKRKMTKRNGCKPKQGPQ